MGAGVFSDKCLRELIEKKAIKSNEVIKDKQIQPSSLDLRVAPGGYCMPYSILPLREKNLKNFLNANCHYKLNKNKSNFIHKGAIYVLPIEEGLNLDSNLIARANPKSSTGRSDIHVRLLTNNGSFDDVAKGYKGNMWIELHSRSFDLILPPYISLNQLRIFDSQRTLTKEELSSIHTSEGILFESNEKISENKLEQNLLQEGFLGINLDLSRDLVGYVAKHNSPVLDLGKKQPSSDYFNKIESIKSGKLIIGKDSFYILHSKEQIKIPNDICAEMIDIFTGLGEFRSHYAGFFDPGFMAQGVLEIRNFGAPFEIRHNQKIAGFKFNNLRYPAERPYGHEGLNTNYQKQEGPKIAKFFELD